MNAANEFRLLEFIFILTSSWIISSWVTPSSFTKNSTSDTLRQEYTYVCDINFTDIFVINKHHRHRLDDNWFFLFFFREYNADMVNMQLFHLAFHSKWGLHITCNEYEGMCRHKTFSYVPIWTISSSRVSSNTTQVVHVMDSSLHHWI